MKCIPNELKCIAYLQIKLTDIFLHIVNKVFHIQLPMKGIHHGAGVVASTAHYSYKMLYYIDGVGSRVHVQRGFRKHG